MAKSRKRDASPDSYICQKEHPHINTHPNEPMEERKEKKLVCLYFNLFKLNNKHKKKVTGNKTMRYSIFCLTK
jgi:hypothetical protein